MENSIDQIEVRKLDNLLLDTAKKFGKDASLALRYLVTLRFGLKAKGAIRATVSEHIKKIDSICASYPLELKLAALEVLSKVYEEAFNDKKKSESLNYLQVRINSLSSRISTYNSKNTVPRSLSGLERTARECLVENNEPLKNIPGPGYGLTERQRHGNMHTR